MATIFRKNNKNFTGTYFMVLTGFEVLERYLKTLCFCVYALSMLVWFIVCVFVCM